MHDHARHPNKLREFRRRQQPRPWTQERLAVEVARVAASLRIPITTNRKSLVVELSRWENGRHQVGPEYRRIFRTIYGVTDEQLGFLDTSPSETMPASWKNVSLRQPWAESLVQAQAEWGADLERREFLKGAAYIAAASTTPALEWVLTEPDEISRNGAGERIGAAHIAGIREMTATFRKLDNQFGGGQPRASLVRYLSHEVAPLLIDGRYDHRTGQQLLSVSAEALKTLGWMSYDAGMQGAGQRYMTRTLHLARAADDIPLGAEILAGLSHQASYLGDGPTAVLLAQAAGQSARRGGLDVLVAEAAVMEAHGHACAGDEAACAKALDKAERALDKADRGAAPEWIGYFDEAYLSAKFGHCFKVLRQPEQAERFALRSLDMDNSYVRGRAFNLALLATAHAQAGDVEQACSVGAEAVNLTAQLESARARQYIRGLRHELRSAATAPAVVAFDELVASALPEAV